MIFLEKINENIYYELYSITTSSSTPPHTLTIAVLHSISTKSNKTQQLTRKEHLPKNAFLVDLFPSARPLIAGILAPVRPTTSFLSRSN